MTNEWAERLYGEAPEGDEDPHASQAVPDPGESPSYVHFKLTAGGLNGNHLGRTVKVTDEDISTTGLLVGVRHWANLISESTLFGPPGYVLGEKRVLLQFTYGHINVSPGASVELLD